MSRRDLSFLFGDYFVLRELREEEGSKRNPQEFSWVK